jgi:hypothetical protein
MRHGMDTSQAPGVRHDIGVDGRRPCAFAAALQYP